MTWALENICMMIQSRVLILQSQSIQKTNLTHLNVSVPCLLPLKQFQKTLISSQMRLGIKQFHLQIAQFFIYIHRLYVRTSDIISIIASENTSPFPFLISVTIACNKTIMAEVFLKRLNAWGTKQVTRQGSAQYLPHNRLALNALLVVVYHLL